MIPARPRPAVVRSSGGARASKSARSRSRWLTVNKQKRRIENQKNMAYYREFQYNQNTSYSVHNSVFENDFLGDAN